MTPSQQMTVMLWTLNLYLLTIQVKCIDLLVISSSFPFTVEAATDKGSCNLQWCALHFLAIWYRDMSSPGEGSGANDSVREIITSKLAEVGHHSSTTSASGILFDFLCSVKMWIKPKW